MKESESVPTAPGPAIGTVGSSRYKGRSKRNPSWRHFQCKSFLRRGFTRPRRHGDPVKLCVCTRSHEKDIGEYMAEGGPAGHCAGGVTRRE